MTDDPEKNPSPGSTEDGRSSRGSPDKIDEVSCLCAIDYGLRFGWYPHSSFGAALSPCSRSCSGCSALNASRPSVGPATSFRPRVSLRQQRSPQYDVVAQFLASIAARPNAAELLAPWTPAEEARVKRKVRCLAPATMPATSWPLQPGDNSSDVDTVAACSPPSSALTPDRHDRPPAPVCLDAHVRDRQGHPRHGGHVWAANRPRAQGAGV